MLLNDQERIRRQNAINFARGSVRLEGFVLDPGVEAINQQFIDGELDWEEHGAAIRAVYLND
jgi:hypothetical protein